MRAVVQRVSKAQVLVGEEIVGSIGTGLVVLLAVGSGDGSEDIGFMVRKLVNLRVFNDADGKLNRSVVDAGGEILLISQFTLYGDCRKGNRPSFTRAAPPDEADATYQQLAEELRSRGVRVATGRFQAMMSVSLVNEGPVTLIIDSKKEFH
jgi:D-tyrosyl-tRNA(Tyr) deacylase